MKPRTGTHRDVGRRLVVGAIASGVLTVGLLTGVALPTAAAQPAEPTTPCTGEDCKKDDEAAAPKVNADQVLSVIHEEYRQGDGGGQISKLIDDAVKLRQQGFRPSNANAVALADALESRPNQTPLVEALKETLAHQRKLQARAAQAEVDNGPVAGPVPVIPGMTAPNG